MTAKTLGLDEKYDIVFRVLIEISETTGDAINFEDFLKAITARIVNNSLIFREAHSQKKEEVQTSVFTIFKERENSQLMNSNTLMTNSSMDLSNNNSGKSFTQLVDIMQKQLLSRSSANTFKRSLPAEDCDFEMLSSLTQSHNVCLNIYLYSTFLLTTNFHKKKKQKSLFLKKIQT